MADAEKLFRIIQHFVHIAVLRQADRRQADRQAVHPMVMHRLADRDMARVTVRATDIWAESAFH